MTWSADIEGRTDNENVYLFKSEGGRLFVKHCIHVRAWEIEDYGPNTEQDDYGARYLLPGFYEIRANCEEGVTEYVKCEDVPIAYLTDEFPSFGEVEKMLERREERKSWWNK